MWVPKVPRSNVISTTNPSCKLLLAISSEQKINFNGGSRLKPVTTCHIGFVVKLLWI